MFAPGRGVGFELHAGPREADVAKQVIGQARQGEPPAPTLANL
jgi:hypothetical protein